jgi:hypothetical protein
MGLPIRPCSKCAVTWNNCAPTCGSSTTSIRWR